MEQKTQDLRKFAAKVDPKWAVKSFFADLIVIVIVAGLLFAFYLVSSEILYRHLLASHQEVTDNETDSLSDTGTASSGECKGIVYPLRECC